MKVLLNIGHPAQVHLFKNLVRELDARGHECKVTTVDKEVAFSLLDAYGIQYEVVGRFANSFLSKAFEMVKIECRLFAIAREFQPDILVGGVGNVYVAHIGKLIRKPSIIFDDTEHAAIEHRLMDPFASAICTPSCYRTDLGATQIRYNGYHELAYLHPNQFTPNPAVLEEIGLTENDPFIIMRFVSWDASHDVGQRGIRDKIGLVKALEQYGRVLITSERALPPELEQYRMRIPPDKLHDLLYYAALYIGEGATMASEAAVLGTPSIYVSSLVGTMGNFIELEETYNLLYSFSDGNAALDRAIEILQDTASKEKWRGKWERVLEDKIDVTAFMAWFIENYPQSVSKMREHPGVQCSCASVTGDAL